MEREFPKNVKQIGNVCDEPKIYVEDYVDTYLNQLKEKAESIPAAAVLTGEILKMDGGLESQMAAKIIIAVMLTVGKIAHCPKRERREASGYLARCRETLGEQMKVGGNAAYLPSGYAMKAKWFYRLPGLYVRCYSTLQSAKRRLSGRGMS